MQPHGGHFWSSMGQVQRPMDIVSLRIDNQVQSLKTGAIVHIGRREHIKNRTIWTSCRCALIIKCI